MNTVDQIIQNAFLKKPVLSKKELTAFLHLHFPNWADQTINWNISKWKEEGLLCHVSRGKYSLKPPQYFAPSLSNSLKRIHNHLKKEFPFSSFCVWETKWLNEFMRHQLFNHQLIVEVEKDSVESVFYSLIDLGKKPFLNPDKEIMERYVSDYKDPIIIKPLVSEAPVEKLGSYHIASLEKLLVDMLIDEVLFASQQEELSYIFNTAFEKYELNTASMKRYASRRGQSQVLEKYIVKILAIQ